MKLEEQDRFVREDTGEKKTFSVAKQSVVTRGR